ncbi:hypothetical protein [Streptococcus marimammalium]
MTLPIEEKIIIQEKMAQKNSHELKFLKQKARDRKNYEKELF